MFILLDLSLVTSAETILKIWCDCNGFWYTFWTFYCKICVKMGKTAFL